MVKRERRAKALVAIVVALAMALTIVPASSAFALGDLQSWVAPTSKSATSYMKDGKKYTYITSATRKVTESTADVLGISNVTVVPNAGNSFAYNAKSADELYDSIRVNARFGIYGSDVNQNMNPYYANYFYNAYQQTSAVKGTDLADERDTVLVDQTMNPGSPTQAYTEPKTEYGTSPMLYRRPDILYAVTSLTDNETGEAISYGASIASKSAYSELVSKIRNKELAGEEGAELYQEGDENYDPYYVMFDMGTFTGSIVNNLYNLAHAAKAIIDRTADTDNPKVTRYEDPLQIASDYEAYLRGTQYAVLDAIANKKVERKTVGIVSEVNGDDVVFVVGKQANGKYPNDYSEFLSAVTDNICDKNNLPAGANGTAIGTAEDLLGCDDVFIYGYSGMQNGNPKTYLDIKDQLTELLKNYGAEESQYPEISAQGPKTVIHHDRAGSVENTVLLGALIGFAYPTVVNPVDSLAYFYENFYHVKDSRLQDALGINLAAMTLPSGTQLSLSSYDEQAYKKMLIDGIAYYLENKEAIDEAYPLLKASDELLGNADVLTAAIQAAKGQLQGANVSAVGDGSEYEFATQWTTAQAKSAFEAAIAAAEGASKVTPLLSGDVIAAQSALSDAVADFTESLQPGTKALKKLASDAEALPETVTADNKDAVADVIASYANMSDDEKAAVSPAVLATLIDVQTQVAQIEQAAAVKAAEEAAAEAAKQAKEKADGELKDANDKAGKAQEKAEQAQEQVDQLKKDLENVQNEVAKAKTEADAAKAEAAKASSATLAQVVLTSGTKSAKKGKITVAWDQVDGVSGYEVKVGSKTYTVKSGTTLKKTVKAKKGSKVKVQVRAYKAQGDNTLYGKWSKAKKVKVK